MQKLAFVASFLAAFITMDNELFDGATTRAVWDVITSTAHSIESQISHRMRAYR